MPRKKKTPENDGAHQTRVDQSASEPVDGAHQVFEGQSTSEPVDQPADVFRLVYRLVEDLQRVRLSHGNRVRAVLPLIPENVTPPRGTPSWEVFFKQSAEVLEGEESRMLKLAKRLLQDDPIGQWMLDQRGIGPALAVSILGECWPLTKFQSPRRLWAFAGMHIDEEGKAVKRRKGHKANWNARLKTRLWIFSTCYMKAGGRWREVYDARKRYEYEKVGLDIGALVAPDSQTDGEPGAAQLVRGEHSQGATERAGAQISPGGQPSSEPGDGVETEGAQHTDGGQKGNAPSRLHLHNRARRFTEKALLKDLWRIAHNQEPLYGASEQVVGS